MAILSVGTSPMTAFAADKTMSVAELQALVSGLGLKDTGDKKTYVSVDGQGAENLSLMMFPTDDDKSVSLYTNLGEIPKDKLAALPAEKMLEYNYDHPFYFSIDGDGSKSTYLFKRLNSATITPALLRQEIDDLLKAVDESKDIWNPDGWKIDASAAAPTPVATKDYKALQDEADTAWAAAPLAFRTALLAKDKIDNFGEYTPRTSAVYKIGDSLHVYVEPIFYAWKPAPGGKVTIDLSADLLIKTKSGNTILDAKRAVNLATDFSSKIKTVDISSNIKLESSLGADDYIVTVTVHDYNGQKTASVDMPFSITK